MCVCVYTCMYVGWLVYICLCIPVLHIYILIFIIYIYMFIVYNYLVKFSIVYYHCFVLF